MRADARPVPLSTGSNATTTKTRPAMPYWCGVSNRANTIPTRILDNSKVPRVADCQARPRSTGARNEPGAGAGWCAAAVPSEPLATAVMEHHQCAVTRAPQRARPGWDQALGRIAARLRGMGAIVLAIAEVGLRAVHRSFERDSRGCSGTQRVT